MFGTEPTMPHVKPMTVWQHLSEAEEKLWGHGIVHENNSQSNSTGSSEDAGEIILRHGAAVGKIHEYFSNLEARKCCVKLSLGACKTTFTNIRLVRHDGRDSGIEEGAMVKTPMDHPLDVVQLHSDEYRVFKCAYLCAAFPVLGAPEPPSSFSPSPVLTPTPQPNQRLTYSGILSISRPNTPYSIPDSGLDDQNDDTTALIPAETLCELVQRAFRLSPAKFNHYEKLVCESYGKQSQQKVLAEELVNQLAALENNSNHFYNPHNFKPRPDQTRNGYDQWQQFERNHLTTLIGKFWHFSLPCPNIQYALELSSAHEDYKALLDKLIRYESPYRSDREDQGPAPTSPLSSASLRLLKEFGLRYGVGEQFRKIVYLHYLVRHFDTTVWYIQHIILTLKAIMELLPSNRNHLTITQHEFDLLENSLKLLLGQAGNAISKMKRLFPQNRPPDGVANLIELLGTSLTLKSYLSLKNPRPLQECLRQYIQEAFVTAYERHKMLAVSQLKLTASLAHTSPRLLNSLIGNIRDEVQDYKINYHSTFERYFNITESAAQAFYGYLTNDVLQLHQVIKEEIRSTEIDLLLLSLAYRLNKLDHDWARYIPPESQRWREPFVSLSLHWAMALNCSVPLLILEAVTGEKFQPLQLPSSVRSATNCGSSQRVRSTSLRSLSASVRSAFSSVISSNRSTPVQTGREHTLSQGDSCGRLGQIPPPILEASNETRASSRSSHQIDSSFGADSCQEYASRSRSEKSYLYRRRSIRSVDGALLSRDESRLSEDSLEEVMMFSNKTLRHSNSLPNFLGNLAPFPIYSASHIDSAGSIANWHVKGSVIHTLPCPTGSNHGDQVPTSEQTNRANVSNLYSKMVPIIQTSGEEISPGANIAPRSGFGAIVDSDDEEDDEDFDKDHQHAQYPPLKEITNSRHDLGRDRFNETKGVIERPHAPVLGQFSSRPAVAMATDSAAPALIKVPSAPVIPFPRQQTDMVSQTRGTLFPGASVPVSPQRESD